MEEKKKGKYTEAFEKGIKRGNSVTDTRNVVGERLRLIRMQHGYTQREIAELANINPITYSGYENKISQPSLDAMCRIADVYNISLDYIAGRTDIADFTNSSVIKPDDDISVRLARLEEEVKKIRQNK